MTVQNGKDIAKAAALILQAWNDENEGLPAFPEPLRPGNLTQAYGIQHAVSEGLGAIGGWVVWPSSLAGGFACAPIPIAGIHPSPARLSGMRSTLHRLVPGIGIRIRKSLPDYDAPFSHDQIMAAVESGHVVIGVRKPRIAGDARCDDLTALADSGGYASLVYSPDGTPWRDAGLLLDRIRIAVAGKETAERSVDAGRDVIAALHWLAHEGSRWAGGLMVGHLIMVAAQTDEVEVSSDSMAEVSIGGLGSAKVCFSSDAKRPAPPSPYFRSLWPSWLRPSTRTSGQ